MLRTFLHDFFASLPVLDVEFTHDTYLGGVPLLYATIACPIYLRFSSHLYEN